ncbi:hypothetical protein MNV49_005083 [Pseudohyphozyma bogoriensis]|nr:hypothetical protein MNV49_005083 [Pseudohyphozyma bogoriensis]
MSTPTYTIESLAYLKPVLHAAKHPSSTVIGLLVGTAEGKKTTIANAIPLLHHWTELSPMMEAGLQMAESYARTQSQSFVGLYVANARLDDTSIPSSVISVADMIKKEFPLAVVLVVDNQKLASSESAFIPYLPLKDSWSPTTFTSPLFTLADPSSPTKALAQVKAGKHALLGDFDDHAEDVRVDWLSNAHVVPTP